MAGQTPLHGCEKRTSTKHHGRRTKVVEMKFLQSIIEYTLEEQKTYEEIRR